MIVRGPFLEDLAVGEVLPQRRVRLTDGLAAAHQAIVGNDLELCLDPALALAVTSRDVLVNPGLVWDVAIGCSTLATREVIANMFYRDLAFLRYPAIGDEILVRTEVLDKKVNRPRADRPRRGLVLLQITVTDGDSRVVLNFQRCAMLPARTGAPSSSGGNRILQSHEPARPPLGAIADWDLDVLRETSAGLSGAGTVGPFETYGDVVSSAPELARLTLNRARVHHDRFASDGVRLVYGGHTIALAFLQASRAIPGLLMPLSWQACDHVAPVREQDTVWSRHEVLQSEAGPAGLSVKLIRTEAFVRSRSDHAGTKVLQWHWWCLTR